MCKKILAALALLIIFCAVPGFAALQQPKDAELQQWMTEMRQYKQAYFAKELDLSRDQQNKFFPLYEELSDEKFKTEKEARDMEKRVADMANPSDTELEKATEALYDARLRTAQLDKEYLEKFKPILSKKQLFQLNSVERKFQRHMMKQHQRLRMGKKSTRQECKKK